MRPLFTIHGGEYLVGTYIQKHFRHLNVWIPSRDSGIDLLVSDPLNVRTLSLQVKFSKDYLRTHMGPEFQKQLRSCGWWKINRDKLRLSIADFWVLVLLGFEKPKADFIIVPTKLLRQRLRKIHGSQRTFQSYLWVTTHKLCWEARGLQRREQLQILDGSFSHPHRNFKKWLNNWSPVKRLNG